MTHGEEYEDEADASLEEGSHSQAVRCRGLRSPSITVSRLNDQGQCREDKADNASDEAPYWPELLREQEDRDREKNEHLKLVALTREPLPLCHADFSSRVGRAAQ